ncbi:hypothetical protein [Luteibacter sp. CQ10]|uniref:hypothetical protein n=1 Tax=Luteibacter sp. CQ10 TaxID=2805821 RepID=UPI0034A33F99
MGYPVGEYDVEIMTPSALGHGAGKFSGHWSIYKRPFVEGDKSLAGGSTSSFDDAFKARQAALNEGIAVANLLVAGEDISEFVEDD